jgi:UDP-3-O-acyl N-acetylglucosamine deacetylase
MGGPSTRGTWNVKRLSYRAQQTLANSAEIRGVGYLTGALVTVRFAPAPAGTGVVLFRADLGPNARIPAHVDMVTGTQRRTTLGKPPVHVSLVEHVLAALAGLHIDNCLVEVNAPEPPGLDGSAQGFVDVLRQVGVRWQAARRAIWTPTSTIVVHSENASLALHPGECPELRASYLLDYGPLSPIVRQRHTQVICPESFANELASCRTFLLEEEGLALQRQGLGAGIKITDLLVFGPRGPIGNALRFGNEPARHKVLDMVGDLSLLGCDLTGHLVGYRSGHPLNVELARELLRRISAAQPGLRKAA